MSRLLQFAASINRLNTFVGKSVSWLTGGLVLLICIDVLMRYVFQFSQIWIIELERYFFAFIFLFGAAYTFQADKHVRVDLFYSRLSEKGKAWVNLIGGVFLLFPWAWIVLEVSLRYARKSWAIGEGSPQPGGLPALYILKFAIFFGFLLLILQCIANIIQSLHIIRQQD